jgi:hypothetical protein
MHLGLPIHREAGMKNPRSMALSVLTAVLTLLLAGCGEAAAPETVETPTKTAPPTTTLAPSITFTPTLSLTLTETPTETPTFTPTIAYNEPGLYYFYKCTNFQPEGIPVAISINFCVTSVKVNDDRTLKVSVTWKLNHAVGGRLTKRSDVGNNNMFLYDDLENEYHATDWGGAAAKNDIITLQPSAGWFLFPAPEPGATVFRFYDMDNRISIDDIILSPDKNVSPPTATPTIDPRTLYNEPGTYALNVCAYYPTSAVYPAATKVRLCLNTVFINDAYEMRFNLTWTVFFDTENGVIKESDANNKNILLADDLGNEYRPTQTGGCAAQDTTLKGYPDSSCVGWFQFPPAKPGATSFRFFYGKDLVVIEDIVLAKIPEIGAVTPTLSRTAKQDVQYNEPGTYWLYKCVTYLPGPDLADISHITFCLNTVVVDADRTMRFNVAWTIKLVRSTTVEKKAGPNDIFLEDDLGKAYNPTQIGGCAGKDVFLDGGSATASCAGWFQFEPAQPGATSFRLVDLFNHVSIENIILVPKAE